jgi:uncharacterized protein
MLMEMKNTEFVAAPIDTVWSALNNAEILARCIPGCESLVLTDDNCFNAVASIKIGPVKARFQGIVQLSDFDPPHGYTLSGSGQGGVAGFAKGGAIVRLIEAEGGTDINYIVNAQVGGKLAQIGARLIDATANSLAREFFAKLAKEIVATEVPNSLSLSGETQEHLPRKPQTQLSKFIAWLCALYTRR